MPEGSGIDGSVSKIKFIVAYFAIYVIWGTTYLCISFSLETLPPFFICTVRFLIAGLVLILYARHKGCALPTKEQWVIAAKCGVLSFFISYGTLTWAQRTIPSSVAALIISLEPAWFVLIDWLLFGGPRPTKKIAFAQSLGFVGCALLVLAAPTDASGTGVSYNRYILAGLSLLICNFTWVYGSLLSRSPASHPDPTMASGLQMFTGGIALLAASLISGDFAHLGGASLKSALSLLYLTAFGSLFAYSAFVFLLRTQPSARVAAHTFVNPIIAVALGWAFAGEAISPRTLVAAALVIASVILTTYAKPSKKQGTERSKWTQND